MGLSIYHHVSVTPEEITELKDNEVFVFGSNPQGRHGAGAAKLAKQKFGAIYGQGSGLQGQSYAIITKELRKDYQPINLAFIKQELINLLDFALINEHLTFLVTKIGCNLAGFKEEEIAQLFAELWHHKKYYKEWFPKNVALPKSFWEYILK